MLLCTGDGPVKAEEAELHVPATPTTPLIPPQPPLQLQAPPVIRSSTPATDTVIPSQPSPQSSPLQKPLSPLLHVPSPPHVSPHSSNTSTSRQHRNPRIVCRVHRQLFTSTTMFDDDTTDLLRQILRNQQQFLTRLDRLENIDCPTCIPHSHLATPQTSSTPLPLTATCTTTNRTTEPLDVDPEEHSTYESLRLKSLSSGHFATLLIRHLFTLEERSNRNCAGSRGKEALDPLKLEKVKQIVFKYYDDESRQNRVQFWKMCISRIDEFLRRKRLH